MLKKLKMNPNTKSMILAVSAIVIVNGGAILAYTLITNSSN